MEARVWPALLLTTKMLLHIWQEHIKGWNTVFAQLLEVDAGAYSKALSGGRNKCTMREEISTAQTDA